MKFQDYSYLLLPQVKDVSEESFKKLKQDNPPWFCIFNLRGIIDRRCSCIIMLLKLKDYIVLMGKGR